MLELTNSWKEEGREEGRQDGARSALLAVLKAKFGPLPESVSGQLSMLSNIEQLEQLVARAAVVDSLEDFLAEL